MRGWLAEVPAGRQPEAIAERRQSGHPSPAMRSRPELIFDVGVCNGDDSAYYLHKGYRVLGIEASPLLVERLQARFEAEIRDGRYQLLGAGIAQSSGSAPFWVCDQRPEWSSFDRSIASRMGFRHHCVEVPTRPFGWVLETYGVPLYAKIDIEGNDDLCLEAMTARTAPQWLSVEMIEAEGQIRRMTELGYTGFKIISQLTLRQPKMAALRFKKTLPALAQWLVTGAESRLFRNRSESGWRFPRGSSGPFGEDLPGDWLSAEQAIALSRGLAGVLYDWCDIHARRAPAAG